MSETLRLAGVSKVYNPGTAGEVVVLEGVDLALAPGEAVALVAPSGAGKSTLLHIAGLLDAPSAGEVTVAGEAAGRLGDAARTRIRRDKVGFVYQFHHLLPEFSALENVAMPQRAAGVEVKAAGARARDLLERVGLGHRLGHRPAELSGGEQQRTAIARALANSPRLLLADEPTGNLDPTTSDHVFSEFVSLIERTGVAALIATHNMDLARRMHRVLRMEKGQLVEIRPETVG
jgi:lipoprotein-releasing system ATP-binding protein